MTQEELVLVARTEQEGLGWLTWYEISPESIHVVTDVDGFRQYVNEQGLRWRLASDNEAEYEKTLPTSLRNEIGTWLFRHPEKARQR